MRAVAITLGAVRAAGRVGASILGAVAILGAVGVLPAAAVGAAVRGAGVGVGALVPSPEVLALVAGEAILELEVLKS